MPLGRIALWVRRFRFVPSFVRRQPFSAIPETVPVSSVCADESKMDGLQTLQGRAKPRREIIIERMAESVEHYLSRLVALMTEEEVAGIRTLVLHIHSGLEFYEEERNQQVRDEILRLLLECARAAPPA